MTPVPYAVEATNTPPKLMPFLVQILTNNWVDVFCLAESNAIAKEMAQFVCGKHEDINAYFLDSHCNLYGLGSVARQLLTQTHRGYFALFDTLSLNVRDDDVEYPINQAFIPYLTRQEKLATLQ